EVLWGGTFPTCPRCFAQKGCLELSDAQTAGIYFDWRVPDTFFGPSRSLIHDGADDFDPHPHRVELVTPSLAEVVVQIAAAQIVEAEPEVFLILGQRDFQGLAGRFTDAELFAFGLDQV